MSFTNCRSEPIQVHVRRHESKQRKVPNGARGIEAQGGATAITESTANELANVRLLSEQGRFERRRWGTAGFQWRRAVNHSYVRFNEVAQCVLQQQSNGHCRGRRQLVSLDLPELPGRRHCDKWISRWHLVITKEYKWLCLVGNEARKQHNRRWSGVIGCWKWYDSYPRRQSKDVCP